MYFFVNCKNNIDIFFNCKIILIFECIFLLIIKIILIFKSIGIYFLIIKIIDIFESMIEKIVFIC